MVKNKDFKTTCEYSCVLEMCAGATASASGFNRSSRYFPRQKSAGAVRELEFCSVERRRCPKGEQRVARAHERPPAAQQV